MIRHLLIFTILFCLPLLAQERDITPALKLIERGDVEAANSILQSYKTDFPNDPSVMFLDGVLTKDGTVAVKKYATVAQRFPNSKYADASLYRIFSYYYSIGYYERAKGYMDKLKYDYPNSPYIKIGDRSIPESETLALTQAPVQEKPVVGTNSTAPVDLLKKSSAALEKLSSAKSDETGSTKTESKLPTKTNEKPTVSVPPIKTTPKSGSPIIQEAKKDTLAKTPTPIIKKQEPVLPNLNDSVNDNFTIQAGAFLNEDNAKKLSDRFKKDGYYSKLGVKYVGGADFNVVYIGRFKNEDDGKIILDYLKDNHRIYGRIIPIEE
ncbi:MAG: SPOR domain-containing protein [Melioribacteraceae bacterium]